MALKDNASLALIPAAYKTSKIYSAIPTDGDGDFTFTRSGSATRVNKAGLVETMATNVGRLNYDLTNGTPASCPSLLLEPSRTNDATYSSDISSWVSVGSPTITSNINVAPDGSNNADGIQDTTGGSFKRITRTISVSANSTYTGSVFVKKEISETAYGGIMLDFINGTRKSTWVIFDAVNGTANNSTNSTITPNIKIEDFKDYWRFSVTATDTGSNTSLIFGYFATLSTSSSGSIGTGIGSVRTIWGLQLEQGSYPTSYIPTSGNAVTRAEDNAFNGGTDSVFNLTEGTLFFDVEVFRPINDSQRLLSLSDGGSNNRILAIPKDTENTMRYFFSFGGSTTETTPAFTYNTRQKIGIAYGGGNIKIYRNGSQQSSLTATTTFTDLDRINFSDADNDPKATAKIYETLYFNTKLTDAQLIELTSL